MYRVKRASHGRAVVTAASLILFTSVTALAVTGDETDADKRGAVTDSVSGALILPRDLWPDTRSGQIIRRLGPLRSAIARYEERLQETPDARICIQYGAGSFANAWAFEVMEWLVALGVALEAISLQAGTNDPDSLLLWAC